MNHALIARLELQHAALNHLLTGITEQQIRQRLTPEKWSIFENIAHLGRYQVVFLERMTVILEEEKPGFDRYAL
jgi:hypothetical protein